MCDLSSKTMDELVSSYVIIRDRKAALKAEQVKAMEPYDEALAKVESEVCHRLLQSGMNSARTDSGTAYLTTRTSVKVADKSAFMDYITQNNAFELMDVRANKTAIEGFMEANQEVPPGVNVTTEQTVGFRRA